MLRKITLVLLSLLLAACQQNPSKPQAYKNHQSVLDLRQESGFAFNGKMFFSDGNDGGSGRIEWQQLSGDRIKASFKAPLGSQSWELDVAPQQAILTDRKGQAWTAPMAEYLLSDQLGWPVPWKALTFWVQGQKDQQATTIEETAGGFQFTSGGWHIKYSKLVAYPGGFLPHKMQARKGEYVIKLAIRQWQL